MKLIASALASLALVIGSVQASVAQDDAIESPISIQTSGEPVAAGLIIELAKPEISDTSIEVIEDKADVEIVEINELFDDLQVVEFSENVDAETIEDAVAAAEARSDVISAEPNWIIQHTALPGDTYTSWTGDASGFPQRGLWDSRENNFSINAPELWKYTTGSSSVTVAVIDTGILPKHPDLAGRLLSGYDFISNAYVARDGNGWDSNPTDMGDWVGGAPSSWHGTAVASLIAANADSKGIVGVAPNVKILPVRVLGAGGGTVSDLATGIRWAVGISVLNPSTKKYIANPNPAKVINMSLAAYVPCNYLNTTLESAVAAARAKGAILVGALGNDITDRAAAPSSCAGVIGVGASNERGERASYSNYGEHADIAAPGGDSGGLVWVASNTGSTTPSATNSWSAGAGTSYSTPLVSGSAALMLSMGYSANEVHDALGGGDTPATVVQIPAGWASKGLGAGILDLSKIVPKLAINTVSISGSPTVGSTITANSNWNGTQKLNYQWNRDGVPVVGATSASYKLTLDDLSKRLSVTVSLDGFDFLGVDPQVTVAPATKTSASVTVAPPKVAISGTMKKGKTLSWGSATLRSNWPSSGYTYSYQWYNNGKAIASKYGGKKANYKLRSSDRGDKIKVKVTISKSGYSFSSTSAQRKVAK